MGICSHFISKISALTHSISVLGFLARLSLSRIR
ncbi:hypothetical protein CASFOL_032580 [Castilleja foliolosa]|uniref:Uncharacterized protein n=1 Tax=Castilleja foliolosa TaxID=1961234 RepID=A0ABD3C2S0_9LAMI